MFHYKNYLTTAWLDYIKDFLKNLFDPISIMRTFFWKIIFELLRRYHKLIIDVLWWKSLERLAILITFPVRLFFSLRTHPILLKAHHMFFIKVFFLEVINKTFMMKKYIPMSFANFYVGVLEDAEKNDDELYLTLAKYEARSYGCSIEDLVKLRYYVRGLIGKNQFWHSLFKESH